MGPGARPLRLPDLLADVAARARSADVIGAAERVPPGASRIAGRGRLLASLRLLLRRVERFAVHRAASPEEQRWACRLADDLQGAYDTGVAVPGARAGLEAVDRRRRISRKSPDRTDPFTRNEGVPLDD